jgi:hypothetical protein
VKRGLKRLFAVLTPLWIVYCLFVYPMQRRARAEKIEKIELMNCLHETPDLKDTNWGCTDWARLKAGTDLWTLRAFYARESWLIALVVVVVPFMAYGFCRVTVWVCRGFTPV